MTTISKYDYPNFSDQQMRVTRTPVLNSGNIESKRQEILEYFHKSFSLYESLFECLANSDAYYQRANPLRHPLIFYYGHTSVFFINKLNVARLIDERVDSVLESTLAIGVDEMSWDDLNDAHYQWPTPEEVKSHRDATREIVDRFIRECEFSLPVDWNDPMWIVMMGIEHERIHLETSSILMRELPLDMLKPHPVWGDICRDSGLAPANELLPVAGDSLQLGKGDDNTYFGWDNEYGTKRETVDDFEASKFLVSNGEFLEFVECKGYENKNYWTDEGWDWVTYRQAKHPVYWRLDNGKYQLRLMLNEIAMPWDWPAEVNYLEAKAFCNWKSEQTGKPIRLPTEAEWYQLRNAIDTDQPSWKSAPGNTNLEHAMSPCPVNRHAFENGFFDILGNVWQWTETPIDGFNGFKVHPVYDDFSTPTFDGKHNLFKGGCWISTGNYASKDSRFAFRRHFFQYSGLRYVQAAPAPDTKVNRYETDDMVARYIEFHWGDSYFDVPNFPTRCVQKTMEQLKDCPMVRALDIGCATARSSFELARHFEQVDAVDFSVRLLEAPSNLKNSGVQRYVIPEEGTLQQFKEIKLDDFPEYTSVAGKIQFMQGDACNLTTRYSNYDLVFAGNLLDRLYDPSSFLNLIKDRIRNGGFLVLASTYNWNEEFTPADKWLGGFKANTGENYTSLEGIAAHLAPEFKLVGEPTDIPFVQRETSRTFQHSVSQLTVWKKRTTEQSDSGTTSKQ